MWRLTFKFVFCEHKCFSLKMSCEFREKASIQASQRRMERKLKELNATLDQERNQHAEQRDQVKPLPQTGLQQFVNRKP